MRLLSTMAAASVAAMLGAGVAQAAPSALVQPAIDTGPGPTLELVRGGCGFGEHRGWYGGCRYNHGWRGAIRYRANHRYYY